MLAQLPPVKRITDQVLGDFGIPREVLSYIDYPSEYDSRDAQRGAGRARASRSRRWRATPTGCGTTGSATSTRTCSRTARCAGRSRARWCVITGASSGIGKGAGAEGRRGRRQGRAGRALGGQAPGDQGRDRGGRRHGGGPPGQPLRARGRATGVVAEILAAARSRGHAGEQRRPFDQAVDRQLVRPLPRLPAHDAAELLRGAEADSRVAARHARAEDRTHHQRLVDRRADQHAAVLGLRREQERPGRVLALDRVRDRRRRREHHDRLHAARAHADDRADRYLRCVPDRLARTRRRT